MVLMSTDFVPIEPSILTETFLHGDEIWIFIFMPELIVSKYFKMTVATLIIS